MLGGDPIKTGYEFIDAWVVLHCAGAQRIHTEVDGVVPRRKAREVPEYFDLAHFGKPFDARAAMIRAESFGGIDRRHIERWQFERALSGRRLFKDQPFTLVGVSRCFFDFLVHFAVLVFRVAIEGTRERICFFKSAAVTRSSTPPQIVQFPRGLSFR